MTRWSRAGLAVLMVGVAVTFAVMATKSPRSTVSEGPTVTLTGVGVTPAPESPVPYAPSKPLPTTVDVCNANYTGGCVPVASDVNCAGDGKAPAYFDGVARVSGRDVYGLDPDGDGWACKK